LAAGEEQNAQNQIRSEQIVSGASHPFKRHLLRSFAPDAMATSKKEFGKGRNDTRRIASPQWDR
jgi:hypothetical protein